MYTSHYSRRSTIENIPILPSYIRLDVIEVEKNGQLLKESVYREYNMDDQNKDFLYTDFSIHNLNALGANNLLHPVIMGEMNQMFNLDRMQVTLNNAITHELETQTPS